MEVLFLVFAFRRSVEQEANQMLLAEHDCIHDAAKGSQIPLGCEPKPNYLC